MTVEYEGMGFTRLGHASVRIETAEGVVAYIDPWSEVVSGDPHDGDVVFVTHDDYDHYDPAGIEAVAGPDAVIVVYEQVATDELSLPVTPLAPDGEVTVEGFHVTAVPAYNRADGAHVRDTGEPFHAPGEVIGLVIDVEGVTIYFPSDTDALPDHETIRADVFIPPIGGTYTMDRHEAADLAETVQASLVLPVHYDTFDAIETDAAAFVADIENRGMRAELF